VDAAIQAVLDRDTVATAYNTTGNIRSFQVVFSHQKQKEPMIGHSSTSWTCGTRRWARNKDIGVWSISQWLII
jgi:hypothetical protein